MRYKIELELIENSFALLRGLCLCYQPLIEQLLNFLKALGCVRSLFFSLPLFVYISVCQTSIGFPRR